MGDRIIVATDGSNGAVRAVALAAEISGKLGRELIVVHVNLHSRPSEEMVRLAEAEHLVDHFAGMADYSGLPADASIRKFCDECGDEAERVRVTEAIGAEILQSAKAAAKDAGAMSVRLVQTSGDYADQILDTADAEGADIIVLGRRGLGRFRELLLGSVTQKVLHATDRTVVVVQ